MGKFFEISHDLRGDDRATSREGRDDTMAKSESARISLTDLTDAEIARVEALLFCAGGPGAGRPSPAVMRRARR